MKKSDLKNGMIVFTEKSKFGIVDETNKIIDLYFMQDKDVDETSIDRIKIDELVETDDERLMIGFILDEDVKNQFPNLFKNYNVGDIISDDEIIKVCELNTIYNREGDLN